MKFNLWAKVFCFVLFVLEPLYAQEENTDATNDYLIIINANNTSVGRLAAYISKVLRGKNKAKFNPHLDNGDYVIVTN